MEDTNPFPIDFKGIKEYFRELLMKYLTKFERGFFILIDPKLYSLFSYVLSPLEKDLKTKIKRLFTLNEDIREKLTDQFVQKEEKGKMNKKKTVNEEIIVFVIRPDKESIQNAYIGRKFLEKNGEFDFNYLFLPRGPRYISEPYFINNPEKIENININILPFEKDVLSWEIIDSFFNCIQQEDLDYISHSYEAISRLEKGYGTIKYKFAVGENAVSVLSKLLTVSTDLSTPYTASETPFYDGYDGDLKGGEIDALFLFDRKVDLITPFCIQQTYEGMLDEHFGITATNLDVKKSIIRGDEEEDKKSLLEGQAPKIDTICIRSDQDLVIDEIRDLHFIAIQAVITRRIIDIDSIMKEKNNYQSMDDLQKYI